MIQIQNIPLPIGGGEEQLRKRAARLLGLNPGQLRSLTLARQSIDARKKSDVHYVCTVHVEVDNEARIMARCRNKNVSLHAERPYAFPPVRRTSPLPPVVVGMGPAGLFAALFLARNRVIPIVLERGRPVEERAADVERFWATGVLDTASNVQFGEGGAGTFSDGKLTTGTHDPRISTVFRALVEAGAPADILYQHKPHIGTDILRDVVRNVRRELLALGCDVRFGHRLAGLDVRDGVLRAVAVDGPGGQVVAAASEEGRLVTNGMSCRARDGANINGGFLVGVSPADFGSEHPLAGVEFQRRWEAAAYTLGGGGFRAPAQTVADFLARRPSTALGRIVPTYRPGVTPAELDRCLPGYVADTLRGALPLFDRKLRGFAAPEAVLTGVESRSSSPVRILRGEDFQSPIRGLYPCGEGAGYAGGITSAAVDGIRVAEAIASK